MFLFITHTILELVVTFRLSLIKFRIQQKHFVVESNNFTSNINVQFFQQLYSRRAGH